MQDQIIQLLDNYKDGVPVKVEHTTIIELCAAAIATVIISAVIVKFIKKL